MNINFLMRNVIITTKNKLWILFFHFIYVDKKLIQPLIFETLPFIATCARRKVCIDQTGITKVKLQYTALIITYLMAGSVFNISRFDLSKYSNAAISFFYCTEPMCIITKIIKKF